MHCLSSDTVSIDSASISVAATMYSYRTFFDDDLTSARVLVALMAVGLLGRFYVHLRSCVKPFKDLPMAGSSHWLLGHMKLFGKDFRNCQRLFFEEKANQFGQVGIWLGRRRAISVNKWEDARIILHAEYFRRRVPMMKKHMKMFLGDRTVVILFGREWKLHRSSIHRAFTPQAVQDAKEIVEEVVSTLVKTIKARHFSLAADNNAVVLDMAEMTKMCTMDVFGRTALSTDFGCCEALALTKVVRSFETLNEQLSKRMRSPLNPTNFFYCLPTEANRQHRQARDCLRGFLTQTIAERRAKPINRSQRKQDALDWMLQSQREQVAHETDSGAVEDSEAQLSDTLMTLLFAGYDTTSVTLTYALYLVSQHPEVEKSCLEEIESGTDDLVYCTGVIYETLRMFPPVPVVPRTMLKPVKLKGGFVVPEGTQVFIPIHLLQQDADVWPEPTTFRPDRWVRRRTVHDEGKAGADDDGTTSRRRAVGKESTTRWIEREESDVTSSTIAPAFRKGFFAFSGGARICPGRRFAMQESVVLLSGILRELKFEVMKGYELKPIRKGVVQRPTGGLPMRIKLRSGPPQS